jgi:short-chain fatty acids transporter
MHVSHATEGALTRMALRSAAWAERWFPDAWVFAAVGVVVVAAATLGFGATPAITVSTFGDGFWSLIPFTMQIYPAGRARAGGAWLVVAAWAHAVIPAAGHALTLFTAEMGCASAHPISCC